MRGGEAEASSVVVKITATRKTLTHIAEAITAVQLRPELHRTETKQEITNGILHTISLVPSHLTE